MKSEYPQACDTYHRVLMDFPTGAHRREACARVQRQDAPGRLGGADPELEDRSCDYVLGGRGGVLLQVRIGRDLREHVLEVRLLIPVPLRHGVTLRWSS